MAELRTQLEIAAEVGLIPPARQLDLDQRLEQLAGSLGAAAYAAGVLPAQETLQVTVNVMLVFVGLTVIQFLIGNYLEPLVAGAALTISPFAVVFAVFFWTFLWGIPGAFIGVPIMITIITLCAQYPSTRWVATLLGKPWNEVPNGS